MISLLLLPLLLEERMRKEDEMEAKLGAMAAELAVQEADLRKEMRKEMKELRKEFASKEEVGSAVTHGLRDLPYLTLCSYKEVWSSPSSAITYDRFLADFNNGDRPGGADGQLDLGTGVFTCLSAGIYSITFSAFGYLYPGERVDVYLHLNGGQVPESRWSAYTDSGTIGGLLEVPGSRTLVGRVVGRHLTPWPW